MVIERVGLRKLKFWCCLPFVVYMVFPGVWVPDLRNGTPCWGNITSMRGKKCFMPAMLLVHGVNGPLS